MELDCKKMWKSFIDKCYETDDNLLREVAKCVRLALMDQNLRYDIDSKEVLSIEPKPEQTIKAGHSQNRLKSNCPQSKREWSKNDIDMIEWLIRCCKKEHEELCNDKYGHQDIVSDLKRDCRKKWNWLESLKEKIAPQSHWKPTEEQMKHLKYVVECFDAEHTKCTHKVLLELLEQLKVL